MVTRKKFQRKGGQKRRERDTFFVETQQRDFPKESAKYAPKFSLVLIRNIPSQIRSYGKKQIYFFRALSHLNTLEASNLFGNGQWIYSITLDHFYSEIFTSTYSSLMRKYGIAVLSIYFAAKDFLDFMFDWYQPHMRLQNKLLPMCKYFFNFYIKTKFNTPGDRFDNFLLCSQNEME